MKSGSRLKSNACDSEVLIIRHERGAIECGGAPMHETRKSIVPLNHELAGGTLIGKRYVSVDGSCELLCIKPGTGTLTLDGVPLLLKEAKPLPSSD